MKKVLLSLAIIATLASCESKLPANINSAVEHVKFVDEMNYEIDSLFSNLTKAKIDNLDQDSLSTLIAIYSAREIGRNNASSELAELLKYTPEYSDHSKVKDKDSKRYKGANSDWQYLNFEYARQLYSYRDFPEYSSKPVYYGK